MLVCAKRLIPVAPPALSLNEVVQRVMDDLPAEESNGGKNKLFLHFMGELLKAASAAWDTQEVTYEWLAEALTHFGDLVDSSTPAVLADRSGAEAQLQLFDDPSLLSPPA